MTPTIGSGAHPKQPGRGRGGVAGAFHCDCAELHRCWLVAQPCKRWPMRRSLGPVALRPVVSGQWPEAFGQSHLRVVSRPDADIQSYLPRPGLQVGLRPEILSTLRAETYPLG